MAENVEQWENSNRLNFALCAVFKASSIIFIKNIQKSNNQKNHQNWLLNKEVMTQNRKWRETSNRFYIFAHCAVVLEASSMILALKIASDNEYKIYLSYVSRSFKKFLKLSQVKSYDLIQILFKKR